MGKFLDSTGLTKLVELIKGSLPGKATSSTLGLVKPDNSTITVDANGAISTGFNLTYDNSTSGLTATTYKTAIDEVVATRVPDALVSTETAPTQNGTINWVYG